MQIRRLPTAVADVDSIWTYIRARNPSAADRQVERFIAATSHLGRFPYLGAPRTEIGHAARGIPVGSYVILYRVTDCVEIVRVVHGARDMRSFAADFATS